MSYMPFQILGIWVRALVSLALLAVGIYLVPDRSEPLYELSPAAWPVRPAEQIDPTGGLKNAD